MELPTWKGAYCPHRVNPLSVGLFNHARGGWDCLNNRKRTTCTNLEGGLASEAVCATTAAAVKLQVSPISQHQ